MPKGKKFEAAEKHFHEKEVAYQKQIRQLRSQLQEAHAEVKRKDRQLQLVQEENEILKERNAALQQTAGLTDSEVRSLVKQAESMNIVCGVIAGAKPPYFQ